MAQKYKSFFSKLQMRLSLTTVYLCFDVHKGQNTEMLKHNFEAYYPPVLFHPAIDDQLIMN